MKYISLNYLMGQSFWARESNYVIKGELLLSKESNGVAPDMDTYKTANDKISSVLPLEKPDTSTDNVNYLFGHLIGKIAAGLLRIADIQSTFIKAQPLAEDECIILIQCPYKRTGIYAMDAALDIVKRIFFNEAPILLSYITNLQDKYADEYMGLSTGTVIDEAVKRGIPWMQHPTKEFIIFGHGINQQRIQATVSGITPFIGVDLAGDKNGTKKFLKHISVPVPEGITISTERGLHEAIDEIGYPMVIKPLDGNHGRGITVNINSYIEAEAAFKMAQRISDIVIVERYIKGDDYRLLVINYKFFAAVKRVPAHVIGDGKSTIRELINDINLDPRRQEKIGNILTQVKIDENTMNILKKYDYSLDTILKKDELLYVKDAANVSLGGFPIDMTEETHPYNIFQAERIARMVGLDICGIDLLTQDISQPMNTNNSAVVEVNAAPGIRMHVEPAIGKSRNPAVPIMDMLFKNKPHSIPLFGVSGIDSNAFIQVVKDSMLNRKTVTSYVSEDGIFTGSFQLEKPMEPEVRDIEYVLADNTVEKAYFQLTAEILENQGLPFTTLDVYVFTGKEKGLDPNIFTTDHDLIKLYTTPIHCLKPGGLLVLNADDQLSKDIAMQWKGRIAAYSRSCNNMAFTGLHDRKDTLLICMDQEGSVIVKDHKEVTTYKNPVDRISEPELFLPLMSLMVEAGGDLIPNYFKIPQER